MASTWSVSGYVALNQRSASIGVGGLDGEVERLDVAAVGELLGAVGVGADQLGLAMPEARQVERHLGRHAHQHDAPARTGDGEGVGDRAFRADGIDRGVGAGGQVVADQMAPDDAADGSRQLGGRHDVVGAEAAGLALLVRVPRANDDVGVGDVAHQPGDGGESHRAGAEDGDHRAVRLPARTSIERRARRRGCRRPAAR